MTSYVTDPLAYPIAFWTQEHIWPRDSREYVFLARAVLQTGAAMFGSEGWTGDEPHEAMDYDAAEVALMRTSGALTRREQADFNKKYPPKPKPPSGSTAPAAVTLSPAVTGADYSYHVVAYRLEKWRKTRAAQADAIEQGYVRVQQVTDWIGDKVRDGEIASFGRLVAGGKMWPLSVAQWQVEPLWEKRVRTCSFNHSEPNKRHNSFIFLDRLGFERALNTLPFAPGREISLTGNDDGPWLSPFMQVMIEAAKVCELGPTPEQHPDVEYMKDRLREIADRRGLGAAMTDNLIKTAATLLRHPDAKDGVKVWKSKLSAKEGSDPKR